MRDPLARPPASRDRPPVQHRFAVLCPGSPEAGTAVLPAGPRSRRVTARPGEFVGDNLAYDVAGPITHGMRAAFVRPHGLRPGEELPHGALLIRHVNELAGRLEEL